MSTRLPIAVRGSGSPAIPANTSIPTIPGYQIQSLIAEGGMATVFLARQISLDRLVALKLLKRFDDPTVAERFPNEGRVIASLSHRNIITIHDLGVVGDRYYISMEYLEGGTLQDRITSGAITVEETLDLVEQIGGCLEFAHRKGIVHRDIKPANILFRSDGAPVLSDFGIAKRREISSTLTTAGTTLGSPYYLSPEQAEGTLIDGRTDLYSLGVVLFELLTGKRPYEHPSAIQVILGHLTKPVPTLPPGLAHYQAFLERLMAKERHERFSTANAMLRELRALRQSETGTTWLLSPVTSEGGALPTKRGRRARFGRLLAATVVATLAVSAWFLATRNDEVTQFPTMEPMSAANAPSIPEPPQPEVFETEPVPTIAATTSLHEEFPSWEMPPLAEMPAEIVDSIAAIDPGAWESPDPSLIDSAPVLANVESQSAADLERATIPTLMVLAQRALSAYRLTTPKGQSANDYYRLILEREPDHQGARQGLRTIADRYADLVENARRRGNSDQVERYLRRGLATDPGHARLLTLQAPKPAPVAKRPARPRAREAPKDEPPPGFRIQR